MAKPTLDLYIGKYVARIERGELPWQWRIVFADGMEIHNKDRRESFVPRFENLVGASIQTISYSLQDTTILFSNGEKWSLNPTQYAIFDPRYGGEVYPQWPEELEEAGIPSHPDEDVSQQPRDPEQWEKDRRLLEVEQSDRILANRDVFLKEEE